MKKNGVKNIDSKVQNPINKFYLVIGPTLYVLLLVLRILTSNTLLVYTHQPNAMMVHCSPTI